MRIIYSQTKFIINKFYKKYNDILSGLYDIFQKNQLTFF